MNQKHRLQFKRSAYPVALFILLLWVALQARTAPRHLAHALQYTTCTTCTHGTIRSLPLQVQEVVIEQTLVGVLLGVPLLALLPTTAVWYLFASLVHALASAASGSLLLAAAALQHNLVLLMAWRLLLPQQFPSGGNWEGCSRLGKV